jgi:EAL domain-containing protein (putative c-di-GMP-specific phosphodiesterase class I)/ActR/RegA family two-component response regulator
MEAKRSRVLIVDDDASVCSMMADLLGSEGYEVVCTQSGIDALHRISQQVFDVIVSDARLPGLRGLELLRKVRETELDLPVILVSEAPDVDSALEAIEIGVVRYLEKPVDPQEFREVVRRAVELHGLALPRQWSKSRAAHGPEEALAESTYHREFKRAIESLWMAFQPIVSVAHRSIFAYEALVRSNDEMLPDPGALLEAAENLDRMSLLGRKIRQRVTSDLVTFHADELVFVNLHPQELADDQLYSSRDPLAEHAHRVVLEITERSQLDNVRNLAERLRRLCDMGYRIALDDLGAGYAGLSSLMQLNPHFVKLDMSLTRDIHLHTVKQKLVGSMFQVCREMGVSVVSEGVERVEERETLQALGGDLMQGYLFGKPAPRVAAVRPIRSRETIDQP